MSGVINAIVVLVVGGIIVAFLGADSPILFIENGCDSTLYPDSPDINLQIRNRGEVMGYSTVCISSNEVVFTDLGNTSKYCSEEKMYLPMSSEVWHRFESDLEFIGEGVPRNFTISINADCSSKVWGIIKRSCEGITRECRYVSSPSLTSYYLEI